MKDKICDVDILHVMREKQTENGNVVMDFTHTKKDLEQWEGMTGWIEESSNPMEPNNTLSIYRHLSCSWVHSTGPGCHGNLLFLSSRLAGSLHEHSCLVDPVGGWKHTHKG